MERIQLGRSAVNASRVVCGTMAIGGARHNRERRIDTIHAALDAGVTTIDTAPLYDLGACEDTVGRAIRGMRDRVEIFTKVGLRWDDSHGEVMFTTHDARGNEVAVRRNSRPESVRLEVERSLERLGVDAVDMVFVHQRDPQTPISETMGALKDLLLEGKLRGIGVSTNYTPSDVLETQRALGEVPLAAVQLHYSLLHRQPETGLLPLAREHRIGVLAHSPLELGLLTGKLTPSSTFGPDDMRCDLWCFHPDNIRRIAAALQRGIEPVATRHGATIAQVVLAWVLAQPAVSSAVVGASWPDQARANAQAAGLELCAEERLSIDAVFAQLQLDPYAGLGVARRMYTRGRRAAGGVRRRVARVVSRVAPLQLGPGGFARS